MKPAIIVICGPAASGKDTLLKALAPLINASIIISDTTRPPRTNEKQDIDYHFLKNNEEFYKNLLENKYLEWSKFRDWFYATSIDSIKDEINIGVFNMDGINYLSTKQEDYKIYPIYLKTSFITRVQRYIKRDGSFKLECIRRFLTDFIQFHNVEKRLSNFYTQHLVLKNFKIESDLSKLAQYIVGDVLSDYY